MSILDEEIRHKVAQWLAYGDDDLRLARHGFTLSSGSPYRLIAYHAQQCAEKHLKAYLVFHRIDFPYTHNIARLLELCADRGKWVGGLHDAEGLTPFAITARYPGEDEAVTEEEARHATQQQREHFEISPAGYGIHWPDVDEDLAIDGLIGVKHLPPFVTTAA